MQPDIAPEYRGEPQHLGEYQGFEVYAMPAFVTFAVPDPVAGAQWYRDALGFGVMYVAPEVSGTVPMVHIRRRKYQDILLIAGRDRPGSVHLDASGELDRLAQRCAAFTDHTGPQQTPYGPVELRINDPFGHRLVFFAAPENPADSIDEAMMEASRGTTPGD